VILAQSMWKTELIVDTTELINPAARGKDVVGYQLILAKFGVFISLNHKNILVTLVNVTQTIRVNFPP